MKTETLPASSEGIKKAAALIIAGEVVAFPTETVYGLGADALNPKAIKKIFAAKDRPADNPLIVHVCSSADIPELVTSVPDSAKKLMRVFWPGPLSIVLNKSAKVPNITTAGLSTVVLRCPAHPVAIELITEAHTPIAAPSANLSGQVSPTSAEHVDTDLAGRIPLILDGGISLVGLESTVIDCTTTPPTLLRPGGITQEEIEECIGIIQTAEHSENAPASPGMKYRHYSPKTTLHLYEDIQDLHTFSSTLSIPHVILHHSDIKPSEFSISVRLPSDTKQASAVIYNALRQADTRNAEYILVEGYPETKIGAALMNRLRKAAVNTD